MIPVSAEGPQTGNPAVSTPPIAPDQASAASPPGDTTRWFAQEVHPHGAQLKAYLRGSFPAVRDVDDVVQESYFRVWKARAVQPIQSAKAFLFTVARRLALDALRHERRSPVESVGDLARLDVLEDRPSVVELVSEREKIHLLGEAVGSLPGRCRKVIFLHKIKGLPQRDVATQLGLSEKIVEHEVTRGVKQCREFFRKSGIESF